MLYLHTLFHCNAPGCTTNGWDHNCTYCHLMLPKWFWHVQHSTVHTVTCDVSCRWDQVWSNTGRTIGINYMKRANQHCHLSDFATNIKLPWTTTTLRMTHSPSLPASHRAWGIFCRPHKCNMFQTSTHKNYKIHTSINVKNTRSNIL
jgi:hypothetical protein